MKCDGMRDDGTCGNGANPDNHNKKCAGAKCPHRFQYGSETESPAAVARQDQIEETIKTAIRQQVAVIGEIELRGNFEKLKLGAMVSEAVKRLQLCGAQTGRGHAGDGALGWWGDVCPRKPSGEPVIAYKTVMMWKQAAENLPGMIGVKEGKREAVVALLAENPEEAVGKDAKILESAEKAANGMTMRQMLLWGGEEAKGKAGRPAGSKYAAGPYETSGLAKLTESNVLEAVFLDLTKIKILLDKHRKTMAKYAPALKVKHPNECEDFAAVAKDFWMCFK